MKTKNKQFVIVAAVVGVVLIAAVLFLVMGKGGAGTGLLPGNKLTSDSETFQGDLISAVNKGVPFKCILKMDNGMEGAGYIKNRNYYGEITANGRQGYIIMKDNCIWSWDKENMQGVKTCFDGDLWQKQETQGSMPGNVECTSQNVDDSLFNIPSNVNFMDIDTAVQDVIPPMDTSEQGEDQ